MRPSALAATLLGAALMFTSACSDQAPQAQSPDSSASASPTGDAATETAQGAGSPEGSGTATSTQGPVTAVASPDGIYLDPDASYAEIGTDRELTDVERALLRKPGPYAGDAFDAQAVFGAAVATAPQSAREWTDAILSQIHPDYVQDAREVINSEAGLQSAPGPPGQELRDLPVVGQNHFAVVLDASGSMADSAGGASRTEQAKGAIRDFVGRLPQGSTASLRIYGHEGNITEAGRAQSCGSTSVVYDGPADGLAATLDSVQPGGWTPLARAVGASDSDIPPNTSDAVVYVVTGGVDTCGGDAATAAEELAGRRLQPVVNVIGFQVGTAEAQQLRDVADAGGGAYVAVESQADLEAYWKADLQAMLDAWRVWQEKALFTIERRESGDSGQTQEPGHRVMDASDQEWEQAQQIVRLMGRDGLVDYETRLSVWEEFQARHVTIWGWGYDQRVDSQREAYEQQVSSWELAYDLGVDRWSRYYGKWAQGD
ncbi:MAG: hypothetical protein ACR2FV_16660 [Ornithinimicrobium sp.]|uniref:hypothetical protein n=1 Tax=Ornithinimicrobium sp. TaxID=1977084 RepID=UPI00180E103B|nr:hypothetical protein [Actinomycetota bacterium]